MQHTPQDKRRAVLFANLIGLQEDGFSSKRSAENQQAIKAALESVARTAPNPEAMYTCRTVNSPGTVREDCMGCLKANLEMAGTHHVASGMTPVINDTMCQMGVDGCALMPVACSNPTVREYLRSQVPRRLWAVWRQQPAMHAALRALHAADGAFLGQCGAAGF